MPTNQETLIRQWHMLRAVPRYPQKTSAQDIRTNLLAQGFEVTERTVQRDLNELSLVFPLTVDDRDRPYGWSWQKNAPSFNLPALTLPEALTLVLAEQHLNSLIPSNMMNELKPYFVAAHHRLDVEPRPHRARSWLDKIHTTLPSQPLIPPKILPEVQARVSDALLHEKQLEVRYRKRRENKENIYRLHPLGLVQRGSMLYLFCRLFDYKDTCILAMNRITSAQVLDDRSVYPEGFSLAEHVEAGVWSFGEGKKISVTLLFERDYGDHLLESPLSHDQKAEEGKNGKLKITATVADTPQLRWWIMAFGAGVEVIGPTQLRTEFCVMANVLKTKYSSSKIRK